MTVRKIRVLVVDDSAMFRNLLVNGLMKDPVMDVVAVASDPYEARDAILEFSPDVMTLDIELPRMNGIEFLRKLLPQYPLPTVVISALSDKVFDALEAGAVEFVNKPVGMDKEQIDRMIRMELITKLKLASTINIGNLKKTKDYVNTRRTGAAGAHIGRAAPLVHAAGNEAVVAIGASTGGTDAIYNVVKGFQRDIAGTVIVQHMPPGFTRMYAERLNEQCQVVVKEAETGDRIVPGQVLIAPGDAHMRVINVKGEYHVECRTGPKVSGHCPSVDVLFESVAKSVGKKAVGVILTGMGKDGADGLLAMRKAGARTIGQNEGSCIVYGMPKVAYDIGAVESQMDITGIAGKIYSLLGSI